MGKKIVGRMRGGPKYWHPHDPPRRTWADREDLKRRKRLLRELEAALLKEECRRQWHAMPIQDVERCAWDEYFSPLMREAEEMDVLWRKQAPQRMNKLHDEANAEWDRREDALAHVRYLKKMHEKYPDKW